MASIYKEVQLFLPLILRDLRLASALGKMSNKATNATTNQIHCTRLLKSILMEKLKLEV